MPTTFTKETKSTTTFTKEAKPTTTYSKEIKPIDEAYLLMESGYDLLLETGDIILLETQSSGATVYTKETKP